MVNRAGVRGGRSAGYRKSGKHGRARACACNAKPRDDRWRRGIVCVFLPRRLSPRIVRSRLIAVDRGELTFVTYTFYTRATPSLRCCSYRGIPGICVGYLVEFRAGPDRSARKRRPARRSD